jgi:hypothetical protein
MKITPLGTVSWTGKLQDGSNLSGKAFLTGTDEIAFYSRLYGAKYPYAGHVAGSLSLDVDTLSGNLRWRKPQQLRGSFLPGGFAVSLIATGGRWTAPPTGSSPMPLGSMELHLPDPVTGLPLAFAATVQSPGLFAFLVNPLDVKLSVNRVTGKMTGSLKNFVADRVLPLQGVYLQNENRAAGFIFSGAAAGGWSLGVPPE